MERLPVISTSPGARGAWFLSLRMFMGLEGGVFTNEGFHW